MKKLLLTFVVACLAVSGISSQTYVQVSDISYTRKTDAYAKERLKLDVYHPTDISDCPVVVWFHGGGLEAGNKEIPQQLKEKGLVVVGVNYRLLPKVTIRETLDDSAEAVAWVFRHISEYGGDPRKIVVSGHSAGGYIAMLLCLNKAWLRAYDTDADDVMMYVPFSGQAVTHYNVRKMQGLSPLQVTIDEWRPRARALRPLRREPVPGPHDEARRPPADLSLRARRPWPRPHGGTVVPHSRDPSQPYVGPPGQSLARSFCYPCQIVVVVAIHYDYFFVSLEPFITILYHF